MRKFNVGDKVRIRKDLHNSIYDECYVTSSMAKHRGEIVTIAEYSSERHPTWFRIVENLDGCKPNWGWSESMVELVEEKKMFTKYDLRTGMFGVMEDGEKFVVVGDKMIYQNRGYDLVCTLDEDLCFTMHSISKVYDNVVSFWNLETTMRSGSKSPVYDRERDTKTLYNGKVVCVEPFGNDIYTKGKIYQFKDGFLTANDGDTYPDNSHRCYSFEDWVKWTSAKFIEVVE